VRIAADMTKAGDLHPTTVTRSLDDTLLVAGVIYGLVNVRTNSEKILCATLSESGTEWHVKTLTSRFRGRTRPRLAEVARRGSPACLPGPSGVTRRGSRAGGRGGGGYAGAPIRRQGARTRRGR